MGQLLPYLLVLACPISMGLMMWVMMRSNKSEPVAPPPETRVAELESQINELRVAMRTRGEQDRDPQKAGT
ncbi:MAG: hypothetical protein DLM67_13390 [Candidatus Nephthysia bennettiae]|nr:MAG: hypothetical protein DLM67_13390 [Candidatus Dormibacteraeota bacterium]